MYIFFIHGKKSIDVCVCVGRVEPETMMSLINLFYLEKDKWFKKKKTGTVNVSGQKLVQNAILVFRD